MTHSDIYTKFMIEYDKAMITSSYPSLTKYEIAVLLDKAYLALIAQKVTGNNPRQAIFEADTKAIEDIRPLLVTDKHLVKSYEPKNGVTNGFTCELPKDMLYFVSATTQLYNVPAVEDRDYAKRRISNVVLVDHTTASKFFATDVNMPWVKTPVAYIEGNDITTIYDLYECMKHGHYPHELNVTYIKKPAKFALSASEQVLIEPQEPTNTGDLEQQGGTPVNPGDTPSNPDTPVNPSDPGNNDDPNGGNSGGGNSGGGTVVTKTALFNFNEPSTLNPPVDMSDIPYTGSKGMEDYLVGHSAFTSSDDKISLQFDCSDTNSSAPWIFNEGDNRYHLRMNTSDRMVFTAKSGTKITTIKFGHFVYGLPLLFRVDNVYYSRYKEGHVPNSDYTDSLYILSQGDYDLDSDMTTFNFPNGASYISIKHGNIKFADYRDIYVYYTTTGTSGGGNSGGSSTTNITSSFDFENPSTLSPSIVHSPGQYSYPVEDITFTNKDILISFDNQDTDPTFSACIYDEREMESASYDYRLVLKNNGRIIFTTRNNAKIKSIRFGNLLYSIPHVFRVDNKYYTYYKEGWKNDPSQISTDYQNNQEQIVLNNNTNQYVFSFDNASYVSFVHLGVKEADYRDIYVDYITTSNSGGNSGGGNSVSTKTYTFKFNNPTKLIPSISENSINNTYPLDNTTFRSYDGKVSISFVNSTMGGGVGIAAMLSKSTTDDGTSFYFLEIPRGALMIVTGNGVNLKSITKSGDSLSGGLYVYEASGGTVGAFADWTAGSTNATVVKFINNGHNPKIYELDVTYSGSGLTTDPTDIPTNPTTPSQTDMEGFGSLDQYVYERYGNSINTSGYEYTNTGNRPISQLDKLYYFINARNSNGSINENPMYLYCNNNIKIKIYLVTNSTGDAINHVVKAYGHLEYVSNFDKEEGFEGCGAVHLVWDTDLTQAITEKAQYLIEVPKGAYGDLNYKKYLLGDTTISKSSCHINGVNHDNCDWESFWVDPNLTSGNNSGDSEYTYNPNDPNDYPKGSDGYFLREYSIPSGADTKITLIYNVYWNMESSPVKDVWFNNIYMYCENISLKPARRPVEIYLWDEGGTASLRTPERKGTFETYQTPYGTLGLHVKWTRPINEENPIEDGTRYVIVIPEGSYCNTEGTHYNAYTYYYFEIDNENGIAITEPIYN